MFLRNSWNSIGRVWPVFSCIFELCTSWHKRVSISLFDFISLLQSSVRKQQPRINWVKRKHKVREYIRENLNKIGQISRMQTEETDFKNPSPDDERKLSIEDINFLNQKLKMLIFHFATNLVECTKSAFIYFKN